MGLLSIGYVFAMAYSFSTVSDALHKNTVSLSEQQDQLLQLSAFFDHIADIAIIATDRYGIIRKLNPNASELLGLDPERVVDASVIRELHFEEQLPDDLELLFSKINSGFLANRETIQNMETSFLSKFLIVRRADGIRIYAALSIQPVFTPRAEHMGWIFVLQNITEYKETEAEILRKQDELRCWIEQRTSELTQAKDDIIRLIDTANSPIFGIDTDGCINEWNQAIAKISGYSKEEVSGRNFIDLLVPHDEHSKLVHFIQSALRDAPMQNVECMITTKQKESVTLLLNSTTRRDNYDRIIGAVVIGQDFTVLNKSRRMLETVLNTVPVRVYWKDCLSRYVGCNILFAQDAGLKKPEEIVGLSDTDLPWKDDAEKYREEDHIILQSKESRMNSEEQMTIHDGTTLWILKSAIPMVNNEGHMDGILGAYQDISAQKTIEATLESERSNLEKIIDIRTKELRESLDTLTTANLKLEEASRHKSNFLSTMSHELRTPLNAVLGYSDLLEKQFFGPLNEKQSSYISQIGSSGRHLLALINDLLDVAKIDAGAMNLELDVFSIKELIEDTHSMLKAQFKKKQLHTEIYIGPALYSIVADQRKLKQIMLNLLSNAIKYTPEEGYVKVHAFKESDSFLKVIVSDTGIGIEPDEVDKVFDEFYQAEKIRHAQLGGTGIGLALTRRLVELHGGSIGVESRVGQGSAFWFSIPLRQKAFHGNTDRFKPIRAHTAEKPSGAKILVAEDNDVNLILLTDMLKINHYEVSAARNGKQVIDMAQTIKPDIILMDIRMPVMDGLEATRRLRSMKEFELIPIIALTASTGQEAKKQQLEAGCTDHLAKPVQMEDLFRILELHVRRIRNGHTRPVE
ncbi:PAS domain S-box protein [bacterium]|nr:PAS domain S-box protein [candidate division CSSED10-310 bacterium]